MQVRSDKVEVLVPEAGGLYLHIRLGDNARCEERGKPCIHALIVGDFPDDRGEWASATNGPGEEKVGIAAMARPGFGRVRALSCHTQISD